MCEFSEKLVAWLDHELVDEESARLKPHLEICSECRDRLAAYAEVSDGLVAYCAAVLAGSSKRRRGWLILAGGAVAAAVAVIVLMPRMNEAPIPPPPPAVLAPAIAWQTTPLRIRTVPLHRARPRVQAQNTSWQPAATDVQIAIPAEAVFPPGALPEGFQFVAHLSIGADGSAQGIRIIP